MDNLCAYVPKFAFPSPTLYAHFPSISLRSSPLPHSDSPTVILWLNQATILCAHHEVGVVLPTNLDSQGLVF